MNARDGLVIYPAYLAADNIRIRIEHPRPDGCGWKISFAGSTAITWPKLEQALQEHDRKCASNGQRDVKETP